MRLLIPSEQLLRPRWLSASGVARSTWGGRGRSCCSPDPGNLFERAIPELRALRLLSPPENPLSTCNRFTWNPRLASTQLRRGNWHKVGEPGLEWNDSDIGGLLHVHSSPVLWQHECVQPKSLTEGNPKMQLACAGGLYKQGEGHAIIRQTPEPTL